MSTDSSKLSCICNVTITRNMYLEDCEQLQGVSLLKHSKNTDFISSDNPDD